MSNNQYGQQPWSTGAQQPWGAPYQQPWGFDPDVIPPEDRSAAALAHGASLIAAVFSVGWLSFVGPLVMWVLYKDRSPYVRQAAAGAFNFNIWVNIMMWVGWVLVLSVIGFLPGAILMGIAGFLMIWTHLRGVMKSLSGRPYTYKHQLRILN